MSKFFNLYLIIFLSLFIKGCAPKSIDMVKLNTSSLEERALQTKSFDTNDEDKILSASIANLQDMGFNIDEINRDLGVVTSSKVRDAREVGQQVGLFVLALLGGAQAMDMADHLQTIRATVVTTPKTELKTETVVRLTLMRVIQNHRGLITKIETIQDQEIYTQFFDKLSKSVFLEEQKL